MELPAIIEDIESLPRAEIAEALEKFEISIPPRASSKKLAKLYLDEIYAIRDDKEALKEKLKKTTGQRKATPGRPKKGTTVPNWISDLTIAELKKALKEHGIAGAITDGNRKTYEKAYVKKLDALEDTEPEVKSTATATATVTKKQVAKEPEKTEQEPEPEVDTASVVKSSEEAYAKATIFSSDEEVEVVDAPATKAKKQTKKKPSADEKPAAPKVEAAQFANPEIFSNDEDDDVPASLEKPRPPKAQTLDDSGALVCQLVLLSLLTMAIYQLAMGANL